MRILPAVAVLLLLAGCTVREVERRERPAVRLAESRFHVHALVAQHGNLGSTLLIDSPDTNGVWAVAGGHGPCPKDVAELMTVIERDDFKFFDSDTVVPRADFLALVLHCGGFAIDGVSLKNVDAGDPAVLRVEVRHVGIAYTRLTPKRADVVVLIDVATLRDIDRIEVQIDSSYGTQLNGHFYEERQIVHRCRIELR